VTWALERAPDPWVIRIHTTVELTRATIEKCPPASPPEGLRSLLAVDGVRSIDLHRYRARLNLSPVCDAKAAWEEVACGAAGLHRADDRRLARCGRLALSPQARLQTDGHLLGRLISPDAYARPCSRSRGLAT